MNNASMYQAAIAAVKNARTAKIELLHFSYLAAQKRHALAGNLSTQLAEQRAYRAFVSAQIEK